MATPQQQATEEAAKFVDKFNDIILFPTIALLSAVAFLVFVWGCVEYFVNSANETARGQGVKHITFGIIGLVVMLSAFAILSIATSTFGLDKQLDCANNPSGPDCGDAFVLPDTSIPGGENPGPGTGGENPGPGTGGSNPGPGTGGSNPGPGTGGGNPGPVDRSIEPPVTN